MILHYLLPVLTLAVIGVAYVAKHNVPASGPPLAVLGSGGHTGELLAMLKTVDLPEIEFVYGRDDALSAMKCLNAGYDSTNFHELPRARKVGEGKVSSVFSILKSLLAALKLVWTLKPKLVLCNGPATCVVVVAAVRLLRLRTKIIYVESLARVQHLSLSGSIIYNLDWADRFLVQWPELAKAYSGTEYIGVLV